ncbi:MAG: T9SS type A sorting domain-containing protein [Fibrobacteria bacterium]|nr:T9SS type A sorting domain-containing protein [Fibrobacteria bacterium]
MMNRNIEQNKSKVIVNNIFVFFLMYLLSIMPFNSYAKGTWEDEIIITYWCGPPVTLEKYQEIADANFNVAQYSTVDMGVTMQDLNLCKKVGIQGMVYSNFYYTYTIAELDPIIKKVIAENKDHPNLFGYHLSDEPNAEWFEEIAYCARLIEQQDPDRLPFVNLLPYWASSSQLGTSTYDQYVSSFIEIVKPKVLSYDCYSLYADGKTDHNKHFKNMEIIRNYALLNNIPFWNCPMSVGSGGVYREPTEGDLRWQVYTTLAYGGKGLEYFTYWATEDWGLDYGNALVDLGTNEKNHKWYYAQSINGEVQALAPVLKGLKSNKVYHSAPLPSNTKGFNGTDFVTAVSGGQAVIGELWDIWGCNYIFLANRENTAARTFTLSLNSTIKGLGKFSRTTGDMAPETLSGNTLSVALEAGGGELFIILTDNTPPSVPINLKADSKSKSVIDLTWEASVDAESEIRFYRILRNDVEVAQTRNLFYSDSGLSEDDEYTYTVSTVNAEWHESAKSTPISQRANGGIIAIKQKSANTPNGPNILTGPAHNGIFSVIFENSEWHNGSITVFKNSGELIYKNKINSTVVPIDLSGQASGVYFLHMTNKHRSTEKKVILY